MENNQRLARRRRDCARGSRNEQSINKRRRLLDENDLHRWRRVLAKMESDAARYRLGDVEMLLGAAGLAIEDMIGQTNIPPATGTM